MLKKLEKLYVRQAIVKSFNHFQEVLNEVENPSCDSQMNFHDVCQALSGFAKFSMQHTKLLEPNSPELKEALLLVENWLATRATFHEEALPIIRLIRSIRQSDYWLLRISPMMTAIGVCLIFIAIPLETIEWRQLFALPGMTLTIIGIASYLIRKGIQAEI